jgi:glutamyl-tRNA reductase
MKKEEIKKAELIREEVRKVINQIFDKEYEKVIKKIETGEAQMTDMPLSEIMNKLGVMKEDSE